MKVLPEPVTPEQHLLALAVPDALDQRGDRLRLVAGGLEFRVDDEALPLVGQRTLGGKDRHGV